MAGYVIELYKNIRSAEGYQPKPSKDSEKKKRDKRKTYVTFGEFDKMAFSKVDSFSRMRDMSELSKTWIGDRQTLLLYEIDEDNEVFYGNTDDGEGICIQSENGIKLSENLFLAVSILQFKESTDRSKTGMERRLTHCKEQISTLVREQRSKGIPVYCSVFGTLGTYGLAIVWSSDQFVEILRLVDRIKGMDADEQKEEAYDSFLSCFSIFAQNNLEEEKMKGKLAQAEGTAMLQVTLESSLAPALLGQFQDKLHPDEFFHCAGEHDLIIQTSVQNLFGLFEKNGLLDPDEDFYRKNILQTNVRLCDTMPGNNGQARPEKEAGKTPASGQPEQSAAEMDTLSKLIEEVGESYKKLREAFFINFPKTAGMVDSLDLLYCDFTSKISSVSNRMWAYDFGHQFLAILGVVKKYLKRSPKKVTDVPTSEVLADFREILNCYEYQIVHIAESNNLLIDTPNCHLRYTGQNNLTLYAYFGITKDVIKLCYLMQENSRQSKITPLITVDIVPIIESTMYIDYGVPDEDRVLKLNFPMMALYNMPEYVPYLYHEIFHYVAPKDRLARNWAKGTVLSIIAIRNLICNLLNTYSGIRGEDDLERLATAVFLPAIYSSVYRRYYDKRVEEIRNDVNKNYTRKEVNEKAVDWRQYEEKLFKQLVEDTACQEPTQNNLIFDVLVDLYWQKDELKKTAEQLIDDPSPVIKGIEKFMEEMKGMSSNTTAQKEAEVYNKLLKNTQLSDMDLLNMDELLQVSTALSEVASDIPMVELAKMEAVHYLISYVKIQKDLLKKPNSHPPIQDCIRIGIVLDFFTGFDKPESYSKKQLNSWEETFIYLYAGLYYSDKKAHEKFLKCLEDLEKEAREWFSWISKAYIYYLTEYRIYSPSFKELIGQVSAENRKKKTVAATKYLEILDSIKKLNCVEYYHALQAYGAGIVKTMEKYPVCQKEEVYEEILSCKKAFSKELFKMNIRWIQAYQWQEDFKTINDLWKEQAVEEKLYQKEALAFTKQLPKFLGTADWETIKLKKEAERYEYNVCGIEELCRVTEKLSERFSRQNQAEYGSNHHDLWYRGHSRTKYQLLPTAMRKYAQQHKRADSLRTYQREAYEEFTFRVDTASEKTDKASYTDCDYLALMQHYGAPTLYMDWSENALSSLYFALEAYIDPKKENEQNEDDAVLFILHPNLYNKARNRLMELAGANTGIALDHFMKETKQQSTNSLPNLSVEYNREKYCMFLLGETPKGIDIPDFEARKFKTLGSPPNWEEYLYLPLAIYSSRANARVRAQFGMFLSFNIFTPLGEGDNFNYMSLESIQKSFLNHFKDANPFMYKIIIKSESKKQIADWLKSIGVSKDMIYPELSNVAERI